MPKSPDEPKNAASHVQKSAQAALDTVQANYGRSVYPEFFVAVAERNFRAVFSRDSAVCCLVT